MSWWASRLVPDPFVLALGLTALVIVGGCLSQIASGGAPMAVFGNAMMGWVKGFGNKGGLAFALQMALILVSGHAIATSPVVRGGINRLARLPRSASASSVLVVLVSCTAALVHWGLGAIVGGLLAREICRAAALSGRRLNYPILGAAAYCGMAVWHGGMSGSAPLKVAEVGHLAMDLVGTISISQTIFSANNLIVTGAVVTVLAVLFGFLTPPDSVLSVPKPIDTVSSESEPETGWLGRLQDSSRPGQSIGLVGICGIAVAIGFRAVSLDINTVNIAFLFVGIFCQGSLRRYVAAVFEGARGAGAIIIQFPLYFAILGVMRATGMVAWMSDGLVSLASQATFPVWAFLSAGLLNLFVPSGGGQWAVQGPILLSAGHSLGVDAGITVMAFSYGDAWTNMLQPFWALPLLGIMGLKARDIIGYTTVAFVVIGGVVVASLLTIF